jgi:hypothetical protein
MVDGGREPHAIPLMRRIGHLGDLPHYTYGVQRQTTLTDTEMDSVIVVS